jgi:hypothetical protein
MVCMPILEEQDKWYTPANFGSRRTKNLLLTFQLIKHLQSSFFAPYCDSIKFHVTFALSDSNNLEKAKESTGISIVYKPSPISGFW